MLNILSTSLEADSHEAKKLDKVRDQFRFHRENVGVEHRKRSPLSLKELGEEIAKLPTGIIHVVSSNSGDASPQEIVATIARAGCHPLPWVILDGSEGGHAPDGVGCVIHLPEAMGDDVAAGFVSRFMEAAGLGYPLRTAFWRACSGLAMLRDSAGRPIVPSLTTADEIDAKTVAFPRRNPPIRPFLDEAGFRSVYRRLLDYATDGIVAPGIRSYCALTAAGVAQQASVSDDMARLADQATARRFTDALFADLADLLHVLYRGPEFLAVQRRALERYASPSCPRRADLYDWTYHAEEEDLGEGVREWIDKKARIWKMNEREQIEQDWVAVFTNDEPTDPPIQWDVPEFLMRWEQFVDGVVDRVLVRARNACVVFTGDMTNAYMKICE